MLVVLLALLASFLFQGSRGLYEPTEGRYAECARETLRSGYLFDPLLNGAHHWSKPPLTYLAIMAGMRTLGENEWGVRAYLVLSFALTVAAVGWAGASVFGSEAGYYASIVYAGSIFPLVSSNVVSSDALLTLWEASAVACFWHGMRTRRRGSILLMWCFFGLGFLTKGPPSLLPLFGIVPAYWMLKRTNSSLPRLVSPLGLAGFFVLGLSWFVLEGCHHPGLWNYWLKDELIARNVTAHARRNPQWYIGPLMYLPILALGALPWPAVLLLKRKRLAPLRETGWKNSFSVLSAMRPEWVFIGGMTILPLGIFLASKSKLPFYVLPLFIPLSLAYGRAIHHLVVAGAIRRASVNRLALATALLFVAGKAFSAEHDVPQDMKTLSRSVATLQRLYPDYALYVHKRPRNGLEFYLGTTLPVIPAGSVARTIESEMAVKGPLLVLVQEKSAKNVLQAVGQAQARVVPTGKKGWLAILVKEKSDSG